MPTEHTQLTTFSKGALTKTVRTQIATHALTVYPIAAGLGSLVSYGILNFAPLMWFGATGVGLGVATWCINQFGRQNVFATHHLERLQEQMRKEREAKLKRVQQELIELHCESGSKQLQKQKTNYDIFLQVLNKKLNPLEVTYGRYLGMVEQVYLATLDNLDKVVLALKSVQSIDRDYIQKQIKALDENGIDNSDADYANLHERLELLEQTRLKVDQLLNSNEKAITLLLKTANKLTEIETAPGRSSMDMEDAMNELSYLTKNIAVYDRKNI